MASGTVEDNITSNKILLPQTHGKMTVLHIAKDNMAYGTGEDNVTSHTGEENVTSYRRR